MPHEPGPAIGGPFTWPRLLGALLLAGLGATGGMAWMIRVAGFEETPLEVVADDWSVQATAAEAAFRRGRYGESLIFLRRATELDSTQAHLWALRAEVAFLVNRHEEAAWAFERARGLDPDVATRGPFPVDLAEVERSLREEGMFELVRGRRPPELPLTEDDLRSDSTNEAARDREVAEAVAAAAAVVAIRVAPDSLMLAPGDTVSWGAFSFWGVDQEGRRIDGFRPAIEIRPPGIVALGPDGRFAALRRGRAELWIRVAPPGDAPAEGPVARLPIIVR